jgi:hypothetical protein
MRLEGRTRDDRKISSVIGCAIVPWGKKEKVDRENSSKKISDPAR